MAKKYKIGVKVRNKATNEIGYIFRRHKGAAEVLLALPWEKVIRVSYRNLEIIETSKMDVCLSAKSSSLLQD